MEEIPKEEEKISEQSSKFLFKIPSMGGKAAQNYVIGVIDASGSMSSYWGWLSKVWNENIREEQIYKIITFDSQPHISPTMKLDSSINKHGGGMTNISEAFVKFEEELEKIPAQSSVTCIFISDGADNNLNTLEKRMSKLRGNLGCLVNFICIGVQSGFPTFLSMNLRKLYHNGDEGIPPLYLIEYASEKAFFNKFQTILPFLKGGNLLDVIPPCRVYPWEDPKSELYEGSWVITEENYVCINDQKIDVDSKSVGIQDLVEIFRNWLQNLHLICLKDEKAGIANAKITLSEMNHQLDVYAKGSGIDLRKLEMKETSSFFDSALGLFMKNFGQRVNWFIEEIEKLAKGDNPKHLSEFEAAKRIQLGTITGKHQQKALALRNISIEEFSIIKKSFIQSFKSANIQVKEDQKEIFPFASLNMRKLFTQDKFTDAFEYIHSQYDLFDALALPGLSINIKRNNGFESNPWLMQVKNLKLSNKTTDSAKIITNSYLLSLPIADSEEKEEINCCLPLFTSEDADLIPLFSHKLIQMIINHFITMNADAYFEDAYYSLLAHAYTALIIDQQKADFYPQIEAALFQSFEMFYQDKIKEFAEQLEKNPQNFFFQKYNNATYICSLSKAFFLISYLNQKKAPIEQLQTMFDNLLLQWCSEFIKENKYSAVSFFVESFDEAKIMQKSRKQFNNALYLSSFKKLFCKVIRKLSTGSYGLNLKALENFNSEIELSVLKAFSLNQLNSEINANTYLLNFYHCIKHRDSIFTEDKSKNLEEATKFLTDQIISNQPKASKPKSKKGQQKQKKKKDDVFTLSIACECYKKLQAEYIQKFMEDHCEVIPLSNEEIKQECEKRNIDLSKIKFSASNLPSNMCLSANCPFYFQILPETGDSVQTSLKKHMDNWQGLKPQNFHSFVKQNMGKSCDQIYESLKDEIGFKEETFKVSKEFTLKYIEKVRSKYAQIKE